MKSSVGYVYTTPAVTSGTYTVVSGTDRDGDSIICDIEDVCGISLNPAAVSSSGDDVVDVEIFVTGVGQQVPPISN
jgi:hypothetical protein